MDLNSQEQSGITLAVCIAIGAVILVVAILQRHGG